jgi:hypothetical protein
MHDLTYEYIPDKKLVPSIHLSLSLNLISIGLVLGLKLEVGMGWTQEHLTAKTLAKHLYAS